jgi:hypothetical protein
LDLSKERFHEMYVKDRPKEFKEALPSRISGVHEPKASEPRTIGTISGIFDGTFKMYSKLCSNADRIEPNDLTLNSE